MGKNQHIVKYSDGGVVEGAGNEKATRVKETLKQAIDIAKHIAKNQQYEMFIYGRNGKIREINSYGNDPFPPKN